MSKAPAEAGSFIANLVTGALAVQRFVDRPTPGNVGVCLSGGGSRALSAGMGQLRGLRALNLLGKTRALSTVSGGSWLGVTFEYLPPGTSDDAYLNQYVPDPGRLVPTTTPGHAPAETLDVLPAGNIGNSIATKLFSLPALTLQALVLYKFFRAPANFLWQAAIGLHILKPYGLYMPGRRLAPTSLFSWDRATLDADVTRGGTQLADETAHLVATGPGRSERPYLVCNTSMFLSEPGTDFRLLAPVQATPFFSGIVGAPGGTDANGRTAGGGGVTSFAFGSNPTAVEEPEVTVDQGRQWAIVDIVGASSAAFAEFLGNLFAEWEKEPEKFEQVLDELADDLRAWFRRHLGHLAGELAAAEAFMIERRLEKKAGKLGAKLQSDFAFLQDLIPRYQYWPVAGVEPYPQTLPTEFADGGNLENTGVASVLSYDDIDNVISFVNSDQRIEAQDHGVLDADGQEVPGTCVVVSSQIPPLFGYQPYKKGVGYKLYEGDDDPAFPEGKNSKVFPPAAFADFLEGIWQASGGGTNQTAALLPQTLEVLANPWFGVARPRTVTVLWCYTARVKDWYDALAPDVQALLGDFDDPKSFAGFPHYSTFHTDLSPTQINLLASLTAWTVAADENKGKFEALYGG